MKNDKELVRKLFLQYDSWEERTAEYNKITGQNKNQVALRKVYSRIVRNENLAEPTNFKKSVIHHEDGTVRIINVIAMDHDQLKDTDYILNVHGFSPDEFIVKKLTLNEWGNKDDYDKQNYQVKLEVEPKKDKVITLDDISDLLESVNIKPITVKKYISKPNGLLEIPLFDMHIGNNKYEYYKEHQSQIASYILSQEWETILFIIGQDLFHNDNFKGMTSNGTLIAHEDMEQAFTDAHKFYQPLLELAIAQSLNTDVIYSRGNHDETLAWAFVKSLETKYEQITFDTKQAEHKHFIYNDVFLGYTHGDKINDKKIVRNFEALFRLPMAQAKRRILKKGHIHTLKSFDDNGTQVMTLGTANETDQWHLDQGFIGNHKSFEIFIYNETSMKAHLYID